MLTRVAVLGSGVALAVALAAGGAAVAAGASSAAPSRTPSATPSSNVPAGSPVGASPSPNRRPAQAVDPCAVLSAAHGAAVAAKDTTAIRKSEAALNRARAQGCPDRVPGKQAATSAQLSALARSLGANEAKLAAALQDVKQSGTTDLDQQAAVFGRALGVDPARAKTALQQLMAAAHPGPDARLLAARLDIAIDRAQWALARIRELGDQPGGVSVRGTDFAALAHQLGVTPAQLMSALDAVKRAGHAPTTVPSPSASVRVSPSAAPTR